MKLVVALALAAAMPSAQAMGKYKACDDSTQCFTATEDGIDFTDACQSVREEATTAFGTDVALYPQWVPISPNGGESGLGLFMGVAPDPLTCWDECVAENEPALKVLAATLVGNNAPEDLPQGCYCLTSREDLFGIVPLEDFIVLADEPVESFDITPVVSCGGESAAPPDLGGERKLETFTGRSLAQGLGWLLKKQ